MKIYLIKVALHGVSPMISRRLRVAGNTSLASLHYIIQFSQGWTDDHLHQFHIYGKDYGIAYLGGLDFSDNAFKTYIDDFDFDEGDRFTYEYNFYEHWLYDIRIESIDKPSPRKKTPFCLSGKGMPGATEYDVYEKAIDLLKIIVDQGKKVTGGDIRRHIEALDTVRFNRLKANRALANLDLKAPTIEQFMMGD